MSIFSASSTDGKVEVKSLQGVMDQIAADSGYRSGRPVSTSRLYGEVGWLNRCISVIGAAAGAVPFTVGRINAEGNIAQSQADEAYIWDTDKTGRPPAQWMTLDGLDHLITMTAMAMPLLGSAYWYRVKNVRGRDLSYKWLMPSSIEPIIDGDGLQKFRRQLGTGIIDIPPEDMVYFWHNDPQVEIGPPDAWPGRAATMGGNTLFHLEGYVGSYFAKGAIKAMLLSTSGPIIDAERSRIRDFFNRFRGLGNAHNVEVIRGDVVTPVNIGEGVGEIGNRELTDTAREEISTAMGVPHSLVMSNAANYATAQQDAINLYTMTIIPLLTDIADTLNRQVMYDMGLELKFRTERIEAMQQNELQKAQTVATLTGRPVMTVNEARLMLGYPELPGGDVLADEPEPMGDAIKSYSDPAERYANEVAALLELYQDGRIAARELAQAWKMLASDTHEQAFRRGAGVSPRDMLDGQQQLALNDVLVREFRAIEDNVAKLEAAG